MMREMMRWISGLFAALLFGACAESAATVECQAGPAGYQCAVAHTGGSSPVNLCWTLNIDCKNGTHATADACQRVGPSQKASKLITLDQIRNAPSCDMATGVSVLARAEP